MGTKLEPFEYALTPEQAKVAAALEAHFQSTFEQANAANARAQAAREALSVYIRGVAEQSGFVTADDSHPVDYRGSEKKLRGMKQVALETPTDEAPPCG